MAFIDCDMVYPTTGGSTHFYGTGAADPLRDDVTYNLWKRSQQDCCTRHMNKNACV